MARKKRYRFYNANSDVICIPTFRTKIDKSKAPRSRRPGDPQEDDALDGYSKHFPNQDRSKQTKIKSSLTDEEAAKFGYNKPCSKVYEDPTARQEAIKKWHSKETKRLPFFTPSTSLGLIGPNIGTDQACTSYRKDKDRKNLTLKEQLDRTILRATRVSMSYACKQYPSLPTRKELDRYAFLFGLKPNTKKQD